MEDSRPRLKAGVLDDACHVRTKILFGIAVASDNVLGSRIGDIAHSFEVRSEFAVPEQNPLPSVGVFRNAGRCSLTFLVCFLIFS